MIKIYRKTDTIKAEQFDPENGIIPQGVFEKEYEHTTSGMISAMIDQLETGNQYHNWHVKTLEGDLKVKPGDWIATGVNGEHWPIADDVFKKTYAELPVIPKTWADTIEECKNNHYKLSYIFTEWNLNYDEQELVVRAWLDGYVVEEEK
ncbi:hypothetical protein LpLQ80_09155 [Lactiplantibacillus plantarum]|uniref:DUF1642 domain-containing protein n=1 Tax=Lactiplantibacillus plantarum TaxID=1590 RepID=UPI000D58C59A|nr:DUF1642 domain-containing protein [Lactiplantibacillus plantarum]AWI40684.1 hypothetical protein LpLQ80_09155 [Lactiplantibacillus plantarum]